MFKRGSYPIGRNHFVKSEKIDMLFRKVVAAGFISHYSYSFFSFFPFPFTMATIPFAGFTYHPYQEEAITWMRAREAADARFVHGGILADEMGLGKTYMTIGLLLGDAAPSKTLLIVPPVLQPQWTEALTKSAIPHRVLKTGNKFQEVAGTRACSVVLATYERALRSGTLLNAEAFDRIICDEGHMLRNGPKTKRFCIIAGIAAPRRWILSGTPIQNHRAEFGNLMRFLGMSMEVYIKTPIADIAREILMRRVVGDVRDAVVGFPDERPTHTIYPVVMPLESEEERVFAALVGRMEHAIEAHASSAIVLELYLRIRQFIAHPAIYTDAMRRKYGDDYKRAGWTGTASKATAFRNYLAVATKEPTIVFGNFRGELDVAETELRRAGYGVWGIRGGMSDSQRVGVITESKAAAEAGKPVAIVIQIVAGGAGLNLQHCSRVCFLSSHWNPAVVDQAIARAYRMGQARAVSVVHFLLADDAERNLDRRIANMHAAKRLVAESIHPKLVCDTVVDKTRLIAVLDEAAPKHLDMPMAAFGVEDDESE